MTDGLKPKEVSRGQNSPIGYSSSCASAAAWPWGDLGRIGLPVHLLDSNCVLVLHCCYHLGGPTCGTEVQDIDTLLNT